MKKVYLILLGCVLLAACQKADVNAPRGSKDVPPQVSVREVLNLSGKSVIYYDLPADGRIKYIKARYVPRPDSPTETNMSYFTDSLVVEGFKDEGDYWVDLYSVSTGGTESEPLRVLVSPLRPPYLAVGESAQVEPTFGGITISADNPGGEKLYFVVDKLGETGEWERLTEYISDKKKISITKRGMENKETSFRFTIEDRWGNLSDPREFSLTPLFEQKLNKQLWGQVFGPGEIDYPLYLWASIPHLWDDLAMSQDPDCYQIASGAVFPVSFTIDLGCLNKLSRMEEWSVYRDVTKFSRYTDWYEKYYDGGDIKDFEVYGAETLDMDNPLYDMEGNLNPNWTLIWAGTNERPSGLKNNSSIDLITEEEHYNYVNGIPRNFDFPADIPPVRYFKIRILTTWGNTSWFVMNEISLYGESLL